MMIYELTPHQLQRAREAAEAYVAELPEWKQDIARAQARQEGLSDGFVLGLADPQDVTIIWAGQVVAVVARADLAADTPLADFGELPPVPDDLSGL